MVVTRDKNGRGRSGQGIKGQQRETSVVMGQFCILTEVVATEWKDVTK